MRPNNVAVKNRRQEALLHLIQSRNIGSQEELQSALRSRGFNVNVATISRDLRELGIVKASIKDRHGQPSFIYVPQSNGAGPPTTLQGVVKEFVESLAGAQNFLVIKTRPRCARLVGSEMDAADWSELLGTIAGDDTIIGICRSKVAAGKALSRLNAMWKPRPAGG